MKYTDAQRKLGNYIGAGLDDWSHLQSALTLGETIGEVRVTWQTFENIGEARVGDYIMFEVSNPVFTAMVESLGPNAQEVKRFLSTIGTLQEITEFGALLLVEKAQD